jgi:hypothetical protein
MAPGQPHQTYDFYLDGVELTSGGISFTNGAGNYANSEIPMAITTVSVGVNQYQDPGSGQAAPLWFTVWLDDVALDTNRITCN